MRKKIIYVLDDDIDILRLCGKILKESYRVEVFSNLERLTSKVTELLPDLFVLDVMIKKKTIVNFLRNRIKYKRIRKIPVVIISGLTEKNIINEVMSLHVTDYMLKPFQDIALQNIVAKALGEKENLNYIFEDKIKIKANFPIDFKEVSEDYLWGETPVKLLGHHVYNIDSPALKQLGLNNFSLKTEDHTHYLQETDRYRSAFKVRGGNKDIMQKLKSGLK